MLAEAVHLMKLDEQALAAWGERLGGAVAPPMVIAITGELGAGKTTLTQAICRGYGVGDEVTSPTFTIIHEYQGARSKVYHLDLYRMRSSRELEALGWDEMLAENALVIVEWPDRAVDLMPRGHVAISLAHVNEDPDRRLLSAQGRR